MMPNWSDKVREHFNQASETYGFDNVWATMLYGSQNYNMATETSLQLLIYLSFVIASKWRKSNGKSNY